MQPRHTQPTTTTAAGRGLTPTLERLDETTTERPTEKRAEFVLKMAQARSVAVAGTFNNWDPNRTPMRKEGSSWKSTVTLAPGRYEYRFVVDGQWLSDPNARESVKNPFGSTNSVLVL